MPCVRLLGRAAHGTSGVLEDTHSNTCAPCTLWMTKRALEDVFGLPMSVKVSKVT